MLLAAARHAHPEGRYLLADAAALPFPDASYDLVIAYNSLMDVDDLPGSVNEAGRVLAPGGRLVLAITHPLTNTGRFLGDGPNAPFVIDGSYFGSQRVNDEVERDGMRMVFSGWQHPLGRYTRTLEDAGLLIEALREPVATRADGSTHRVPWHLWIRAVRPTA